MRLYKQTEISRIVFFCEILEKSISRDKLFKEFEKLNTKDKSCIWKQSLETDCNEKKKCFKKYTLGSIW